MVSLDSLLRNNDLYTPQYFLQDDVCRLCWTKNADREICSKLSENNRDSKNQLLDKIRYCLGIDLSHESFPNKVCDSCFNTIEKFHDFKNFCIETDRRLRETLDTEYLTPIKASIEVEEPGCDVKVEKFDDFPNFELSKTDSLDSFLDILQSDENYETECIKEKKVKAIKKYKPKRSPTYCNICRRDFESKEKIIIHNAECHGVEINGLFKCFGCEKRFKSRKTRLGHETNFCKELRDGYKCTMCDRHLPNRKIYESHMRNHRDNVDVELPEEMFKCTKCFKLFKTKDNLKKHMLMHDTEKKNFICESCGRVFTRQDYLHKHKLTHTGVKQHVCPHCGFRATQRSSLTVHIRKHTGERPYSCDVCPQRCISSSNLRAHRRRHLGLKRYECSICSKKFGYKISLEEHVASTHERSQSHACQHCGAIYTRIRGLRRHLLAKHGKQSRGTEIQSNDIENVEIQFKDTEIQAKDTEIQSKVTEIQSKDEEIQSKDEGNEIFYLKISTYGT